MLGFPFKGQGSEPLTVVWGQSPLKLFNLKDFRGILKLLQAVNLVKFKHLPKYDPTTLYLNTNILNHFIGGCPTLFKKVCVQISSISSLIIIKLL